MAYVLIVVFLSGYGSRPTVVMQEFTSNDSCIAAANEIRGAWKRIDRSDSLGSAVCMKK